jgi:hypothetical protein
MPFFLDLFDFKKAWVRERQIIFKKNHEPLRLNLKIENLKFFKFSIFNFKN